VKGYLTVLSHQYLEHRILKICVAADDNMQLVSMEASNATKSESDRTTGSPAAASCSVSLADNTGVQQQSVPRCLCITNTSSTSPTHLTHSLQNSAVYTVVSSSAQVPMINKHSAAKDSDRRRGWIISLI